MANFSFCKFLEKTLRTIDLFQLPLRINFEDGQLTKDEDGNVTKRDLNNPLGRTK